MTIRRLLVLVTASALLLLLISSCDREITRIERVAEPSNCFECHSDQETFLVAIEKQWENSVHSSGLNTIRGTSSSCSGCHASEGFLDRVAGERPSGYTNPTVIHCFTCHAPHSDGNFNLRITAPQTLQDGSSVDIGKGNLCAACHQARREFASYFNGEDIDSEHWGPHHGPQADMIFGANGYEYDGYDYNDGPHSHGVVTEDGCVTCHVHFVGANFAVGGHTFNMSAQVEGEGEDPEEIVNTQACEFCHTSFDQDDFDYAGVQTEIEGLLEDLEALLFAAGIVDADGHPVGTEDEPNPITEEQAGALWNFLMVEEDRSHGIHNPDFIRDLLESSIAYMESLP